MLWSRIIAESNIGFKRFETAAITISGVELAEKIRKHQFKAGKLAGRPKTAADIWAAILAVPDTPLDNFHVDRTPLAEFATEPSCSRTDESQEPSLLRRSE